MQPGVKQSTVKYTRVGALPDMPATQESEAQLSSEAPAVAARVIAHGSSVVLSNSPSESETEPTCEAEASSKNHITFR